MELRAGTPEEAGMSAPRVRRVAELAAGWVAQGTTPALVVLAARRGVIVLHEAFGRLTPEPDAPPVQRDTLFPLASLTKPITATAAMILVEDGLLGLNRPVSEYLPEFTGEGKEAVMVHHLLTHTSGLRDGDLDAHVKEKTPAGMPSGEELSAIAGYLAASWDAPLWKPPGTEMSYCNYGYELLGEIVRRVSGHPLEDFARNRIFGPLGMNNTFYSVREATRHRIVRRPADAPGAAMLETREFQETPWACAGAFSTAADLAIFGQMFLQRGQYGEARILSPASVAAMTRNQIPGTSAGYRAEFFPEASWGYGWEVYGRKKALYESSLLSAEAFGHSGWGGVNLRVDPRAEIVALYLAVGLHAEAAQQYDLFMNALMAAVL